jgi:hypothetical protein
VGWATVTVEFKQLAIKQDVNKNGFSLGMVFLLLVIDTVKTKSIF